MFKLRSPFAVLCVSSSLLTVVALRENEAGAQTVAARERIVFFTSRADPAFVRDDALQASRTALAEASVELSLEPRPAGVELAATLEAARKVATAERALAVVWIDVERADVTLYFFDSEGGRLLSRRVAVSASQAAAAEELAIILRSAANALLEGGAPEMTEVRVAAPAPAPPKPLPEVPPPVASEPLWRLALGASYFGTWFAAHQGLESGVRFALAVRPTASPLRVGLAYTWFPEVTAATPEVEARVTRHPGELWFGFELGRSRLRLAPELSLMADLVHRRTERAETPLVASAPSSRWLFSASLRARGLVNFAPGFWFTSSVGLGVVANPFEQVVTTASVDVTVLSVLSVRPELELGIRWDLF